MFFFFFSLCVCLKKGEYENDEGIILLYVDCNMYIKSLNIYIKNNIITNTKYNMNICLRDKKKVN